MRLGINMMKTMKDNREKIITFETEQVYSYGSLVSRTDIVLPVSRHTMIQNSLLER